MVRDVHTCSDRRIDEVSRTPSNVKRAINITFEDQSDSVPSTRAAVGISLALIWDVQSLC